MIATASHVSLLYDHEKQFLGVFLSPEIWEMVQNTVRPILESALDSLEPGNNITVKPEPSKEWDALAAYWDFKYPLPHDIHCLACGASSMDWRHDEPRLFRLTSANLGGLASFTCQGCGAKVVKKHFKDHVVIECHAGNTAAMRQKTFMTLTK